MTHPSKMHGSVVQVLKFGESSEVIVDNAELDKMFSHPDVKNRKVVVFSIIGAFRTGKSFFLDYCLRYLYANYKSINNPTKNYIEKDWMGTGTEALTGFSWRAGVKRDTTGIIMWSDVFLHTMKGEKIAIVVMDTQGLFDTETSPVENSNIFAISTLISSIQILNLSKRVQEDQLQYLQFATEFAKFTASDSEGTTAAPFQNLIFMIRDWENEEEFELGADGGARYLKEVLKVKDGQKPELKSVRESLLTSFETVACCLMSYPGRDVAGKKDYNGQWNLMDKDFRLVLMAFIEELLDPGNFILKKINGAYLRGFELKEYIKSVALLFQSVAQPKTKSIYEFVIDQQMTMLTEKCLDIFKATLEQNQSMATEDNLESIRELCASKALMMFKQSKKMGTSNHAKKYKAQLEAAMAKLYTEWRDRTVKSLKQAREEKAKVEKANEEKKALERKALEAERRAKIKQEELDRTMEKLDEERLETKNKERELRSLRMSQSISSPSGSCFPDMSDLYRQLGGMSTRSYSESSYGGSTYGGSNASFSSIQSRMQCQGTTQKGLQCKNTALPGSSRCRFNH